MGRGFWCVCGVRLHVHLRFIGQGPGDLAHGGLGRLTHGAESGTRFPCVTLRRHGLPDACSALGRRTAGLGVRLVRGVTGLARDMGVGAQQDRNEGLRGPQHLRCCLIKQSIFLGAGIKGDSWRGRQIRIIRSTPRLWGCWLLFAGQPQGGGGPVWQVAECYTALETLCP